MRIGNRAYVYSTSFRFIHYGYKPNGTDVQWIVAPLIENRRRRAERVSFVKREPRPSPS
jgi:hypothetical protein